MTTLINEIASHLPTTIPVADRQTELGLSDNDLRRMTRAFGYNKVARDADLTEVDLLVAAAGKLDSLRGREENVRYVVRARTVRSGAPYPDADVHTAANKLGLSSAEIFAISDQACATSLFAFELAGSLLAEDDDPDALALVLVGEKTYGQAGTVIPGMSILGEGVSAMLLSKNGTGDALLGQSSRIVPLPGGSLAMDAEATAAFGEAYSPSLRAVIHEALDQAGIGVEDLKLYLPHNVGRLLCVRTATGLGLTADQVITDGIGDFGHCWGADPFLNLRAAIDSGRLAPGDHYLMTSVGLGAIFSAAVLRH